MGPQHKSCGEVWNDPPHISLGMASMGPQHKSCGEPSPKSWNSNAAVLQWGRSIRAAESVERLEAPLVHVAASMGPQHKSCGEVDRPGYAGRRRRASMGPQHKSCGEYKAPGDASCNLEASMGPQHKSCGERPHSGPNAHEA